MPSIEVHAIETHAETVPVTPTSEIYYTLAAAHREKGADTQQPMADILQYRHMADSLYAEAEMFADNERRIREAASEQVDVPQLENTSRPAQRTGHSAVRHLIGGFFER